MTSATDPHPHASDAPDGTATVDAATATEPPAGQSPTSPAFPAPPTDAAAPRWSLPVLIAVLVLATVLYSWNLSTSEMNSFYSSAIYSGTKSWKAWFFGSLDAGNFITVDKPPFALMVMGLSARIFGYGTWQMMLPEIGAALGTIWILHTSVKRYFGHVAAAIAALVLALTPITVAINRDNNPDTILVLLMVAGAALGLRAVRTEKLLPLVGAAVCFGLAFNTKLLAGYIALPAVFAVYVFASKLGWKKKVVQLAVATVALAVSSFWWATAVSLVPASDRPYIGGSTDGTAWDLIMGYDGLGRIFGGEGNGGGGGGGGGTFAGAAGIGRMFNDILGGQISWLLPFSAIALVGALVLVGRAPRTDATRAALVLWGGWTLLHYVTFAFAQGTMHPYYTTALAPGIAALTGAGGVMLWGAFRSGNPRWAWVLPAGLAVTAVWAVVLLRRASGWNTWLWPVVAVVMVLAIVGLFVFRSGNRGKLLAASVAAAIAASLAGPAAYAISVPVDAGGTGGGMGGTNPTAGPSTGGGFGGGGGRGGFGGGRAGGETGQQGGATGEFPGGGTGTGAGANPGGEMMQPGGGTGELPQGGAGNGFPGGQQGGGTGEFPGGTAGGEAGTEGGTGTTQGGPGGGGGFGGGGMGGTTDTALIKYLKKHQDGATWLIAVSNSQSAGSMILASHEPVISMWGFTGSDNAMTLAKLKELVKKGELHYIQVGSGGGGMGGDNTLSQQVTAWVEKNGTAVKSSAYEKSSSSSTESTGTTSTTSSIYRLDPSDVG